MQKPQYRKSVRNLHSLGLAAHHADVNAFPRGGEPALIWAADYGTPAIVKALLARGANVNAQDKRGRTALHYAACNGDVTRENVRLLLAAGADVNIQDKEGRTPLMVARGDANIRLIQNRRQRMTLREEVETTLKPLLGQRLSDMWRVAGMQLFEIGVQRPFINRKGEEIARAESSLHVSCCWFIKGPQGEIVSSDDFGPEGARRDEKAESFYNMLDEPALQIVRIRADNYGGIRLTMAGDYILEIWPCWESEEVDDDEDIDWENWRFLPETEEQRHLVIRAGTIERY